MKYCKSLVLYLVLTFLLPNAALAQSEYWDTENRKKAQDLSSSALNHLKSINADKKKRYRRSKVNHLQEAVVLLERAVNADPTDPLPHYLLGIALSMQGKYENALPVLQKANKLDPNEYEILLAAGLAQHLSGDYERAVSVWSKLLSRAKRQAPIYVCLGNAQLRAGKLEEAIENFSKAQELEPSLQSAQEGMARVYFLAGDLYKGQKTAAHAQSILDYSPVVLLQAELSSLTSDSATTKSIIKAWQKRVRKFKPHKSMTEIGFSPQHDFQWDPFISNNFDNGYAILARAILRDDGKKADRKARRYIKKGKLNERLNKVRAELSSKQNDYYLYHEKGLLELALQDYNNASQSFNKAMQICKANKVDLLNFAMAKMKAGNHSEAAQALKKFKSIYPETRVATVFSNIKTETGMSATAGDAFAKADMKKVKQKKMVDKKRKRRKVEDNNPF